MARGIVYYATKDGRVPAADLLAGCPPKIEARFSAVLEAVRDAPPPQFSDGGYWEAMHGDMGGYHEIRLTGITLGIAVVGLGLRRNLADVTRSWLPWFGEAPKPVTATTGVIRWWTRASSAFPTGKGSLSFGSICLR